MSLDLQNLQQLLSSAGRPEEDIKSVIAQRIRATFVELIPEDVLKKAVEEEIAWFTTLDPEPTHKDFLDRRDVPPKPTRLQVMIRSVLARRFESRLCAMIDSLLEDNTDDGEVRDALEAMVTKLAPQIWRTVVHEGVEHSMNLIRDGLRRRN